MMVLMIFKMKIKNRRATNHLKKQTGHQMLLLFNNKLMIKSKMISNKNKKMVMDLMNLKKLSLRNRSKMKNMMQAIKIINNPRMIKTMKMNNLLGQA